jgi:hypothetical protein
MGRATVLSPDPQDDVSFPEISFRRTVDYALVAAIAPPAARARAHYE